MPRSRLSAEQLRLLRASQTGWTPGLGHPNPVVSRRRFPALAYSLRERGLITLAVLDDGRQAAFITEQGLQALENHPQQKETT